MRRSYYGKKWNGFGWATQFHSFPRPSEGSNQSRQREPLQDFGQICFGNSHLSRNFVSWRKFSGSLLCQENQCLNGNLGGSVE